MHMQAQVAEISPVIKQLNVVVEGERLIKELNKAYARLSQTAKIAGFRQGKIPRQVLERYYKKDVEGDVLGRVISDAYREAVVQTRLEPVAQPEIQAGEFVPGQDFTFSAKVEVRPAITLKNYKGLATTRSVKQVTDALVDAEIERARTQVSTLQPVTDRETIEKGDLATCNFVGTVDDAPFVGGTGSAFVIEVGAGRFFKDVEDAMPGKKLGEAFECDATIPEDFRTAEVRGKKAHFRVTAVELKSRKMPALDDEFAKDLGDYESLADLKTKLREGMAKRFKDEADRDVTEGLMTLLIEGNPFDLPPSLVERQIDARLYQTLGRIPPEQLRRMNLSRERLREDAREGSIRQVRGALLLDALAAAEGITVNDSDVEAELLRLAETNHIDVERVRQQFAGDRREELKGRLRTDKALEWLKKDASVVDKPA
jgi:trigger factor